MNFSFFIAKRYLVSKKSQNAINIISGISVAAICVGTMALVVLLSAFNGISDLVRSLYHSFGADLQITINEGKTFSFDSTMVNSIKRMKGVKYYTEVLEENALLRNDDQQSLVTIRGVSDDFAAMSHFDTLVSDGVFSLRKGVEQHIVLGRGVSYQLNAGPGNLFSPLVIYAPKRGITRSVSPEDAFNTSSVFLSGIFSINEDFDDKYAIVSIDNARKVFGYTNELTAIELGIDKGADINEIKKQLQYLTGDGFTIKDHNEQNALLFKTLNTEKLWMFIILGFILVVATFNVIGSLTMLIIEKKKDIRILWNMGADVVLIRRIFLFEGLIVTMAGALSGLLLGTIICWGQIQFKWLKFDENFIIPYYPVKMLLNDYLMILGVVFLIGLIAAWYPVKIFTNKNLVID